MAESTSIDLLTKITHQIRSTNLLATVGDSQSEHFTEMRDTPNFEERWLEAFAALNQRATEISEAELRAVDVLREAAFKAAYRNSLNPDFAAFVSDDFELIARAIVLGVDAPWINGLWLCYKNDRFPIGELAAVSGYLRDML
jgi:hypothetical protein